MYQYRENKVEKLSDIPEIKYVNRKTIDFTLYFRIRLFESWKESPGERSIEEGLKGIGIVCDDVANHLFRELHSKFLMGGYPLHQGKREYMEDTGYKESNPLILSGKYHRLQRHWGLEIDPEFRKELKSTYPNISIEEKMAFLGLDPLDVGYNRINRLKREFEEEARHRFHKSEKQ